MINLGTLQIIIIIIIIIILKIIIIIITKVHFCQMTSVGDGYRHQV